MKLASFTSTAVDSHTVYVNPDQVVSVRSETAGTVMVTAALTEKGRPLQVSVREPLEEVVSKLTD